MKRSIIIKSKIYIVTIMLFIIIASCISTYYITIRGDVYSNYRIKRTEETQSQSADFYGNTNMENPSLLAQDSVSIQAMDDLTQLIHSHKFITFFLIAAILSFIQLYLQIKRRNILVSQTENKTFLVHYLKLKDGKKSALSIDL